MEHLFICGTPLQARIAEHIIDKKKLPASDCVTFFYTNRVNQKYLHYFHQLSKVCETSQLFVADGHTAGSLYRAKKELGKTNFKKIYLASPISAYSLLALGLGRHTELYTFDDGLANIFAKSLYASESRLSLKKAIALRALGSSYSPERVKKESIYHYTIYPQFKNNISDRIIPISLFDPPQTSPQNPKCSIVLGTVFHEVFGEARAIKVLEGLMISLKDKGYDAYFLPHPRDLGNAPDGLQKIDTVLMAEDEILKLLHRYSDIYLYGFCSSTQANLAHIPGIHNILLKTQEILNSFHQMENVFSISNWQYETLQL